MRHMFRSPLSRLGASLNKALGSQDLSRWNHQPRMFSVHSRNFAINGMLRVCHDSKTSRSTESLVSARRVENLCKATVSFRHFSLRTQLCARKMSSSSTPTIVNNTTATPTTSTSLDLQSSPGTEMELASNLSLVDPLPEGWWPPSLAEAVIVAFHEATGLPWWLSIASLTILMRTALFPFVVFQVTSFELRILVR
jgi:hypothetical protein